jgi:hypothetical protein
MRSADVQVKLAARPVFGVRHGVEVPRVDAGAVPAQVVELEPRRDLGAHLLVGEAVCPLRSTGEHELAVSTSVERREPRPTFGRWRDVDLAPKAFP